MILPHQRFSSGFQEQSDKDIWASLQRGEKKALEFIYCQYVNDLYNYGMKIKGHSSLVKDCIQELFVELWKSRHQLSATDNIKFYLLKALKFKIHHHLKKEMTFNQTNLELSSVEVVLSPESLLIQGQLQEEQILKLNKAIKQLPPRQQEILHLLFFEGFSYEQISEIMAIHVQSVYTLAWKSLAALRKKRMDFVTIILMSCTINILL